MANNLKCTEKNNEKYGTNLGQVQNLQISALSMHMQNIKLCNYANQFTFNGSKQKNDDSLYIINQK